MIPWEIKEVDRGKKAFWCSERDRVRLPPSFAGGGHVMLLSWKQGKERLRDCCKHRSVICAKPFSEKQKVVARQKPMVRTVAGLNASSDSFSAKQKPQQNLQPMVVMF